MTAVATATKPRRRFVRPVPVNVNGVAIANADGEVAAEEQRLLDGVRVTLALRRKVEALAA